MIIKVGGGLEPLGPVGVYAYAMDFGLQCSDAVGWATGRASGL